MQSSKSCFVIMPIGKEGTPEHAHFRSVFEVVIKPGVELAGYDVWRADESAFTGSITKELVEALAVSDLVIADLTDRNPNVYLELGIRHCLRRSGTIHLIRADQALPFDIAGYRAIKYSTDFDKIDAVRTAITEAIHEKERAPDVSDNPVHDTLTLPTDYRSLAESEQVHQIQTLQEELARVSRESEVLRRRYQAFDASGPVDEEEPTLLDERQLAAKLTAIATQVRDASLPAQLIVRAQHAASEGDLAELVANAQKLLLDPFTSDSEYRVLAQISGEAGLDELRLLVLEQAAARFPGDAERLRSYAEACIHASDPNIQARGKRLLEASLGVTWKDDAPVFAEGVRTDTESAVGVLLDYYHSNDRTAEELALALSALKAYGPTPIILRNVARAYEDAGDDPKAEEYYEKAVDADPTNDTALAWFGNYHARRRDWKAAMRLHVRACEADPDDPRLVLALMTICMAEAQQTGTLKDPGQRTKFQDLAAVAIARGNGAVGVRTAAARSLNVSGHSEAAKLCLDPHWPTDEDVAAGVETLITLGSDDAHSNEGVPIADPVKTPSS